MARWRALHVPDKDLPGLPDQQLLDCLAVAKEREWSSENVKPRNPGARRDWKNRRQLIEAELERRGLR